ETGERHAAAPLRLREQEPGDQEPGEDEEDVDADVAAAEKRDAGVAEDDEQHRNRPETLDVVSVRRPRLRPEPTPRPLAIPEQEVHDWRGVVRGRHRAARASAFGPSSPRRAPPTSGPAAGAASSSPRGRGGRAGASR